ncbi:MAG: YjaG family protein [Spirochaetales bacterium]|jgi:hypothetical protein|nr:YjaG family protein [Spirochaetales bacterium]
MDKYKDLTSKGKNEYLKALESIGWFDFSILSKDTINERLKKIEENERFVFCLYDLSFDAEGFEDAGSYKSLLEEIMKIVKLKDYKINVENANRENNINIKIETKNNEYDYLINLDENDDWIDEAVIDYYINNLLAGENIDKKFLPIPPEDQTVQFIFIEEKIYEEARKFGIIPECQGYFIEK